MLHFTEKIFTENDIRYFIVLENFIKNVNLLKNDEAIDKNELIRYCIIYVREFYHLKILKFFLNL